MDPDLPRAPRERLLALLISLPPRLGFRPVDGANWPDWPAWRAADELALSLRIEAREFTFLHSLDPERSARLVVECRCGIAPRDSAADCHRKLLVRNHQNFAQHHAVYALDASTHTVVHSSAYLLESLDIDALTKVVVDTARRTISWQDEFAPVSKAQIAMADSLFLLQL